MTASLAGSAVAVSKVPKEFPNIAIGVYRTTAVKCHC